MTALRVGLLAPDLAAHHGWGAYSLGLLRALQRAGLAMTVVTADGPQPHDLDVTPLLPSVTPFRRGFLLRQMLALPAVRRHLYGCTHLHALVEPYAPLAAWAAAGRPVFMTAHGTYAQLPRRPMLEGAVYRHAFRQAQIIAVSAHTAALVRDVLPGAQPVVISNGIDAARFLALPRQPAPAPTILFVGAVKARKGVLELVEAFAQVRAQVPAARLEIVGALDQDAAYVAQLQARAAALGNAVTLHGRLSEAALLPLYSAAQAFALPAQAADGGIEGFGLALLEASAAGLPVVATRGSGTEDAVVPEVTGLLVSQGDRDALASALLRLLRDDALAVRLGAAGRAHAAAQTWDAAAARLIGVWRGSLSQPGALSA